MLEFLPDHFPVAGMIRPVAEPVRKSTAKESREEGRGKLELSKPCNRSEAKNFPTTNQRTLKAISEATQFHI